MLILTERHTEKDIMTYSQYQEIDRLETWSQNKADISINEIRKWCYTRNAVALTSWGKDSIVMLRLLVSSGLKIPIVWARFADRHNPDCELVRDSFLAKYDINYHEEIFNYSEVRKGDKHWKIIAKKYSPFRITGIRNDESKTRLLQYLISGHSSKYSCRPLALWKSSEVFAYIEQNGLPLCPAYGYLGGGRWKRDRLRTHSLAGTTGSGMGRTEWESEYYPDLLRRIKAGALHYSLQQTHGGQSVSRPAPNCLSATSPC